MCRVFQGVKRGLSEGANGPPAEVRSAGLLGLPLGPDELEAADCLASLVAGGSGTGFDCAREILGRRNLVELARATPAQLVLELGLDARSAARITAAFALARKLERYRAPARSRLRSPRAVWRLLRPRMIGLEQETFVVLLLDGRNRLQRIVTASTGSLTTSLVHPREVFRAAIREAAAAIIVAHNHPSGDPEPSPEDVAVTRRLFDVGELVGIPLLDHIVLGDREFVSMRGRFGDFRSLGGGSTG